MFVKTEEHRKGYEIELWEAKIDSNSGCLITMENHLTFAKYKAEEYDVDISTVVKDIRLHGREVAASKAFKLAGQESRKGNEEKMNTHIRKYLYLCSMLDKEPDEEVIEKLEETCQKHNKSSDDSE